MMNSELVYVIQWFMHGFKANFNFNLAVNKLTPKVPGCSYIYTYTTLATTEIK